MNEQKKIQSAYAAVKAPEDTVERVQGRIPEKKRHKWLAASLVAALLVLCTTGVFAVAKFHINSDVLPPAASMVITCPFGDMTYMDGLTHHHDGMDIAAPTGTPVLAAADGTVLEADYNGTDGNYVKIQHADGYVTIYKCLASYSVAENDVVSQGDPIGTVGSTGRSTGPHLHLELLENGTPVDPAEYFAG